MENLNSKIVAFHIGRGGRFNNPGFITFLGFKTIDQLHLDNDIFDNPEEGIITDANGNELCTIEDYNTGVCRIEFDTDYDTYYTKRLEDIRMDEAQLIYDNCDDLEVKNYLANYKERGYIIEEE